MMKQIYIIRHCAAEGQPPNARLTPDGEKQAEELADFLYDKQIDCIVSSPFLRAVQTIEPLSARINVKIQIDNRLRERVLSGQDLPDWLDHLRASSDDMDMCLTGGESGRKATIRVTAVIEDV